MGSGTMRKDWLRASGIAVIAACVMTVCVPQARGSGILLGPFCIEGVELAQDPEQETITLEGKWVPIFMDVNPEDGSETKARLALFDKPLPKFPGLPTCREAASEAKKQGIRLV